MNILIVDDDIVDRELITRTLKRSNISCEISGVESVDQGLEQLKKTEFDAVLLDYNLPKRNGIELLVELRSVHERHDIPVIMMSTSKDDELALNCINAGAQDFLVKTEINVFRLQRAIVNSHARADLEKRLYQSYQHTKELAEQDSLTGISSRYHFDESLSNDLKSNERNKTTLALLLIDLDHFKYVNDNYGHDIGDSLLIEVVNRIHRCLRGNELFARLGGDEFAITLTNINSANNATHVAQRIIDALSEPFTIDNHIISSAASIGISISPDDSVNPKELFKYADIAMYKAKSKGRNQFSFFEEAMQVEFLSNFHIENQLKEALKNKHFNLHYQPVMDPKTQQLTGVEALIRWEVDGVAISPDKFIPIAEKSRLIFDIGQWVIEQAIRQLSNLNLDHSQSITMAINLSAVQLTNDSVIDVIHDCIKQYNVDANLIEFEITETALIVEPEKTVKIIQAISDLGCKISLDDFGTGFSSLSHLHSFPIDIVKIDKSLMPSYFSTEKVKKLLSGLIVMLKSLKLQIVAEGVETQDDLDLCINLGVDKVQGYFFDKALPVDEFERKYLQLNNKKVL